MKKIICLGLALGIIAASCNKEKNTNNTTLASKVDLAGKIKRITEEYRASLIVDVNQHQNIPLDGDEEEPPKLEEKSPEADRVIAADVVGGLAGGWGGPLGAFLGALAASTYDILQQTSLMTPVGNSNTKDSNGYNSLNPFDYFGTYHNDFVYNFYQNYNGVIY